MRSWTIVLFILAIHACLAMFTVTDITNAGLNISIDTTGHSGSFIVTEGTTTIDIPSSDPQFFDSEANGSSISGNVSMSSSEYNGGMIESIIGLGKTLTKLIGMFGAAIFSIHTLSAPYFGDFNAWILEGMVDIIFAVSLFQLVTGRSFKSID